MSASLALPIVALMLLDQRRRSGAQQAGPVVVAPTSPNQPPAVVPPPRPRPPTSAPAATVPPKPVHHVPAPNAPPPAWPTAVPVDLPPFPGPGWMPHPQPGRVASRAAALLKPLWAKGEGSSTVEQTAGEWTAYKAAMMGTKRGVIAYVPRPRAATASPAPAVAPPSPVKPQVPRPAPGPSPIVPQMGVEPPPPVVLTSHAPTRARPVLKYGSTGPDVVDLQNRLGIAADGKFGPGTRKAVEAFQKAHGLKKDGIVGPNTWAALDTGATAPS